MQEVPFKETNTIPIFLIPNSEHMHDEYVISKYVFIMELFRPY